MTLSKKKKRSWNIVPSQAYKEKCVIIRNESEFSVNIVKDKDLASPAVKKMKKKLSFECK